MEGILSGQCDVAIVNSYYFGRLEAKDPQLPLKIFWPNQNSSGVHVNISGAGITRFTQNPKAAQALLEWLSSEEAQQQFAQLNHEYPVLASVKPTSQVAAWGDFKRDQVSLEIAGSRQVEAVKLMDRAGYR